jgi:hypothetical protein
MSGDNGDKPAKVPVLAGNQIRAIIPDSLDAAWRLAQSFVAGGITPRGMQRPEQVMVAILAGLEVGLRPLQAVQSIYIVNGRPQLFGDALVAVIRASGKCEYVKEWIEGSGESLTAWCETKRRDEAEPIKGSFSWAMAKRAGLAGKEGPWSQYPARMLKTRARNFVLRDAFADVLRGLSNDEDEPLDVGSITPRDDTPPDDSGTSRDEHVIDGEVEPPDPDADVDSQNDEPASTGVTEPEPPDPDAESDAVTLVLEQLTTQLKAATNAAMVDDIWTDLDIESALTHDEDAFAMAQSLRDRKLKHLARKK